MLEGLKAAFQAPCALDLVLVCTSGPLEPPLKASITDDAVFVTVMPLENVGDIDCIVFVTSTEGEPQFELAAGVSITVSGMTQSREAASTLQDNTGEGLPSRSRRMLWLEVANVMTLPQLSSIMTL